jgi:stress-induced morphogen
MGRFAHGNTIAGGLAALLNVIKKTVHGIDDDGSCRLVGGKFHLAALILIVERLALVHIHGEWFCGAGRGSDGAGGGGQEGAAGQTHAALLSPLENPVHNGYLRGNQRIPCPMAMAAHEIERFIKDGLPDAVVEIKDLAGDGNHYAATVVSSAFKGKSRVQQHQMVYAALKGNMGGVLHALALTTSVPE